MLIINNVLACFVDQKFIVNLEVCHHYLFIFNFMGITSQVFTKKIIIFDLERKGVFYVFAFVKSIIISIDGQNVIVLASMAWQ
jgi:hypothetical protein